jgi:hypothetical protein
MTLVKSALPDAGGKVINWPLGNAPLIRTVGRILDRRECRRNWIEPVPRAVSDEHTTTAHVVVVITRV